MSDAASKPGQRPGLTVMDILLKSMFTPDPIHSPARTAWSTADIADAVEAGLRAQRRADDVEQAVYGFDALPELGLHPLLQRALRQAGYRVWPEQRYPGDCGKARKSEGRRCDIVLTRDSLPLRDADMIGTLFDTGEAEAPDTAYWLEVKTVAQYDTLGPCRRYSAELCSPVMKDLAKLDNDGVIRFGGLLLVLFTQTRAVAEHDLAAWWGRCLKRGHAASPPVIRGFELADRIGNGWCAVAVVGVSDG